MNNVIQIERLRCANICGKRRLFLDWKCENLKPQGSLCVLLFLYFLFRSSPSKSFSKVVVLIFRKIPWKTPALNFCFSCRHGTSHHQKLNNAACCPWNFEAVIYWNIFDWLLHPKSANGSVLYKKLFLRS